MHAICFNNRFYTLVQELAARRRLGTLDRVMLVRASVSDDTFWLETDWDWRLLPEMGGPTIVTSTTGSHLLDLTSFVIGSRVVAVCADFLTAHEVRKRPRPDGGMDDYRAPGEDVSNLLVHWENGARGVLSLSHVAVGHPYRIRVEIDATAMGVSWDSERPNELWLGHRTEPNEIVLPDPRQATEEGSRFMDNPGRLSRGIRRHLPPAVPRGLPRRRRGAVSPTAPTFPTFQDGYGIQIVHDAALQSFRERRWVDCRLVGLRRQLSPDWRPRPRRFVIPAKGDLCRIQPARG